MTIEPISSTMTLQAQNMNPPAKEGSENSSMDATTVSENPTVDAETLAVNKTPKEDSQASSDEGSSNQQQTAADQKNSSERIKSVIEKLNKNVNHANQEAVFGIHEKTNRVTIKIMDKETKEVVKEYPPEKTLDMIAKVWEIAGIIVDEKR